MSYSQPPPPPPPGYPPGPPSPPPGYSPPGYGPPGGYYYGPPQPPGAAAPHGTRAGGSAMAGIFIGVLVGVVVLVGIIVLLNQPPPPDACPVGDICPPVPPPTVGPDRTLGPDETLPPVQTPGPDATPVSNAPPYVAGTPWRSSTLGYSFEYNDTSWTLDTSQDAFARLTWNSQRTAEVNVVGFPATTSVESALQSMYAQLDSFIIGRTLNSRPYDAVLGAGIGYTRGESAVFSGSYKNADGTPGAPVGITVVGATSGRATVVIVVLVADPDTSIGRDTLQRAVRQRVDHILKTFLWDSGG